MMRSATLLLLALLSPSAADVDTYPIKSIHLDTAMTPAYYDGYNFYNGLVPGLSEAHVVNGIETSDGGFVVCGFATPAPDNATSNAFASKIDADGAFQWGYGSKPNPTAKASAYANGVVELPNGGLLLAGTVIDGAGVGARSLTKLSAKGHLLWTSTDAFSDSKGSSGAWELAARAPDGVILAGFDQLDCGTQCKDAMMFKSAGITAGGKAVVVKLPFAAFSSDVAPPTRAYIKSLLAGASGWSVAPAGYETVREARPTPDGKAVVCLLRNDDQGTTELAKLSAADGSTLWSPGALDDSFGQGTSIAISDDGNVAMTGLSQTEGRYPQSLVTVGRLSLFGGEDGALRWTRHYSVGGVPELIRHECWGVVATPGSAGYIITCGTGIEPEQCNSGLPKALRENCTKGIGDNRPGAVPRAPDTWQSMAVMADARGELLWQRVDSYRPPHSHAPLGASGGSAAEWGVLTSQGGVLVCMDDPAAGSLGLMKLQPKEQLSGSRPGVVEAA